MAAYKITPLTRPGLRVFQATLPFQHRPAREIILCELAEDRFEIDVRRKDESRSLARGRGRDLRRRLTLRPFRSGAAVNGKRPDQC